MPAGCRVRPGDVPDAAGTVLVDAPALWSGGSPDVAGFARGRRLLVEVTGPREAAAVLPVARELTGNVGLIARGREAGGRTGDLTTFLLLQRLLSDPSVDVPVYAAGGIGPHTAAAAVAGGAAGVVLDVQLALVREADPPAEAAAALADARDAGIVTVQGRSLPVGQDGRTAAALAARYRTAGGVVQAVREQIGAHLRAAVRAEPLAPRREGDEDGSGPAYPVVQGPMTHISDRSVFAGAVAQEGGLPFLALGLMDAGEATTLLHETADRLGGLPWGVGVAAGAPDGFVPPDVREAQLAAVRAAAPPYALLAGGSPAEAAALEAAGTAAYLHVPCPDLLDRFLDEGARRFVLPGCEGGGHVGARAAFPLWDAQVGRLLALGADAAGLSVMFAGGVHDARSAAMVAALAGPLAERGADVRVLMGTAYLFTTEAVATGAIVPGYQEVALACDGTALLETSGGRLTRCARTPYAETFADTRRELEQVGTPPDEVARRLEKLNLARLELAAKGLRRSHPVDADEQRAAGLYVIGEAAALRSSTTGIAALHEQVTAGATAFLASRAADLGVDAARPGSWPARRPRPADVAIVGMACVLPGARDADGYWANVVAGTRHLPGDAERATHDPACAGRASAGRGAVMPDVPFDPDAHGIPPDALAGIPPIQLLALEVAARALRDAGYDDRPFDRSRTSVIVAAGDGGDLTAAPTHMIAGRIAHVLDLAGGTCTVDAGGAASLAALDAACERLASGTSDMVVCGAADLGAAVPFDDARDHLLAGSAPSPPGSPGPTACAAFDASADGAVPAEGVACVVLKRLADAERDGDRVYAVVRSVAASGDGRSPDPAVPSADGQRLAIERAHERAGVSPASIGLVEAHGTGDAGGDRTELSALASAFRDVAPGAVTLGSVKAQIGDAGRAAGLAGLIKTACALHTGVLPGSPHLTRPLPEWDPDGPFAFGASARPWTAPPRDRYAGVSAFGHGGANYHAVLSGYDGAPEPVSGLAEWPAELFLIRAADRAAARAELARLRELAEGGHRLRDLARTAACLRGPVQVAFVATGPDDLREKLALAVEFRPAPGVLLPGAEPGQVAFLFPGPGGERPAVLADLFVAFPRLQRLLRLADGRYAPVMFPPAAFTPEEAARRQAEVSRVAAPVLGIAGLAVHRLLTAVGVHPDAAAGHGHGELVALCAAGVLGETDLIDLSDARCAADVGRDLRSPAFPVWSNATGAPYDADPAALAATLAGHAAAPVRFAEQIEAMYAAGVRTFVEVGPGQVLTRLVGEVLGDRPHTAVGCDAPGTHGLVRFLNALAELAAAGVPVDPLPLFAGRDARPLTEPGPAPGWFVGGHAVRVADGARRPDAPHPGGLAAGTAASAAEAAVLEYLRTSRELMAAQREVILRHLGALPSASVPAPRRAEPPSDDLGEGGTSADDGSLVDRPSPPAASTTVPGQRPSGEPLDAALPDNAPSVPASPAHGGLPLPDEGITRHVPDGHGGAGPDPSPPPTGSSVPGEIPAPQAQSRHDPAPAEGGRPGGEPYVPDVATVPEARPDPAAGPRTGRPRPGDRQVWPLVEQPGPGPSERCRPVRHVLRAVELDPLPRPPESGTVFAGRRFLVVDDGCGIAAELAVLLQRHGAHVQTVRDVDGPCDGLIHLGALRPAATGVLPEAYEGVRRALGGGLRWLVLASGAGGRFGRSSEGGGAEDPRPGAGLRGLARTVAQEYPEVLVRALDLDTKATPRAIALRILAELLDADAPVAVGHEGRLRLGFTLVPQELDGEPVVPLAHDGVVLISGEARGFTAHVALELARTSGCHIEFLSRAPEPEEEPAFPDALDVVELRRALVAAGRTDDIEATIQHILAEREIRRNLETLRKHAASVGYRTGDVRSPQIVREAVADLRRRHGRLDGIVHGVAPAENRPIQDKTHRAFERVYRTTVDGACTLAQAAGPALGFFVVLGGAAGPHGARGRADRAAASDACAAFAHVWRARLRGRVLVADWEPRPDGAEPGEPDAAALLKEIAHGDEPQVVFTVPAR
ncbi:MAG TPA: SDR family oxidoreductase [Spirillospora sp.]